jgi:hypothetical protein
MKIALIKKKIRSEQHHSKKKSSAKKTYQIKTAKLVPVFAARWRSINKYFSEQTIGKTKQKEQQLIKRHTHLHYKGKPKGNLEQSSQSHYNSHFNL